MRLVIPRLRRHFARLERRLKCFSDYEYQAESWMKAEFLYLLDGMKRQGIVQWIEREKPCGRGRRKVDVVFGMRGISHWVELKHWLIGPQKGKVWKLPAYFDGLEHDAKKLTSVLSARDRGWILVLCTANPRVPEWRSAVKKFNVENNPVRLIRKSAPNQYPGSNFLGLMECRSTKG
jgi:hypothetical protein